LVDLGRSALLRYELTAGPGLDSNCAERRSLKGNTYLLYPAA